MVRKRKSNNVIEAAEQPSIVPAAVQAPVVTAAANVKRQRVVRGAVEQADAQQSQQQQADAQQSQQVGEAAVAKRSGLHIARKLTPETCAFFGWAPDSEHSRVEITKAINEYIRQNGLQKNPNDMRNIYPDEKLQRLLQLSTSEPLMFKDVQKHYVHLFAANCPVQQQAAARAATARALGEPKTKKAKRTVQCAATHCSLGPEDEMKLRII